MIRRSHGCIAVLLLLAASLCAETASTPLISDGLMLDAAQGTLKVDPNGGRWLFSLSKAYRLGQRDIPAEACFELLPSAALTHLVAKVAPEKPIEVLLWARITQYRGRNYLYLSPPNFHILPRKQDGDRTSVPDPNEENAIGIPQEVLELMKHESRSSTGPEKSPQHPLVKDVLLIGRRGRIEQQGNATAIILEGIGRNVLQERLILLPGRVRAQVENEQAVSADRLWFRVAGMKIEFQGRRYLLLHQASRLYSYGNGSGRY